MQYHFCSGFNLIPKSFSSDDCWVNICPALGRQTSASQNLTFRRQMRDTRTGEASISVRAAVCELCAKGRQPHVASGFCLSRAVKPKLQ